MPFYDLRTVPNPGGDFEAFIIGLCERKENHLVGRIIYFIEGECEEPRRSDHALVRHANGLETHFLEKYFSVRIGRSLLKVCCIIDQKKRIMYLIEGRLCYAHEVAGFIETAATRAAEWANTSPQDD